MTVLTDTEKVIRMIEIRLEERPDLKARMCSRVMDMFTPGQAGYYEMLKMYNERYEGK